MQFWQNHQQSFEESWKIFFHQKPKTMEFYIFSRKKFLLKVFACNSWGFKFFKKPIFHQIFPLETQNAVLTAPSKFSWQLAKKLKNFRSLSERRKNKKLADKYFSSKYFFRKGKKRIFTEEKKVFLKNFLSICRLQFWKPRPNFFRQRAAKVRPCPKVIIWKNLTKKELSPQNTPMDTRNAVFRFRPEQFWQNPFLFLQCATMTKNYNFFQQKRFSTKRSSGDAEISFDNTVDKFSKKTWKNFAQNPKR